jgi:hypothetical protein
MVDDGHFLHMEAAAEVVAAHINHAMRHELIAEEV